MQRARAGRLVAGGVAAVALGGASLATFVGSAASSAATRDQGTPAHGSPGVGPAGQGAPGWEDGAALAFTPSGGTATWVRVSSYDFTDGSTQPAGGAATAAATSLVVTTPLASPATTTLEAELNNGSLASVELVVHGHRGTAALDATFTSVTVSQADFSSAAGGTVTWTLEYSSVSLGSSTPKPATATSPSSKAD